MKWNSAVCAEKRELGWYRVILCFYKMKETVQQQWYVEYFLSIDFYMNK